MHLNCQYNDMYRITVAGRGGCARGTYEIKFLNCGLPASVLSERDRDVWIYYYNHELRCGRRWLFLFEV